MAHNEAPLSRASGDCFVVEISNTLTRLSGSAEQNHEVTQGFERASPDRQDLPQSLHQQVVLALSKAYASLGNVGVTAFDQLLAEKMQQRFLHHTRKIVICAPPLNRGGGLSSVLDTIPISFIAKYPSYYV